MLGKRAFLLLQGLDLLGLGEDELSLRLVDLELLLVGPVRCLQLSLQGGVLVFHVIGGLGFLTEDLQLLPEVLDLRILVCEVVSLTRWLVCRVFLSQKLLFLELFRRFRSLLQGGLSHTWLM